MKKIIVAVLAVMGFAFSASAQCGDDLLQKAMTAMGSLQYIKDFDFKAPGGAPAEYTVVLNSRTEYQFNIANGQDDKIVVQIFSSTGDLLGSNQSGAVVAAGFRFKCSKTGAYKLKVTTSSGGAGCARAVLSLFKQYTEAEWNK